MVAMNWSCHFIWVWSDISGHATSADKEQSTKIYWTSSVIVSIFCIQWSICGNFKCHVILAGCGQACLIKPINQIKSYCLFLSSLALMSTSNCLCHFGGWGQSCQAMLTVLWNNQWPISQERIESDCLEPMKKYIHQILFGKSKFGNYHKLWWSNYI